MAGFRHGSCNLLQGCIERQKGFPTNRTLISRRHWLRLVLVRGFGFMRLGTRLRRIMAMMILLLGLLAGLGVASAQEDAPIPSGEAGPQTPRVADGASATLPSSATVTPLSSPSPIQAATPLSPTPDTPSSMTGNPDSAGSAPAKSADKTGNQAVHTVHFDPADGSKPTQSTVKTGTLATPPEHNPVREGFRFDGWTYDGRPYDFRTPVLRDMTLKAQWSKTTDWTLSPSTGPPPARG